MARGATLAETLLWDRPALQPGALDVSAGLFVSTDALGVAGQATYQLSQRLAAFARAQAAVVRINGQWDSEAAGIAGVRYTW